ncbi:MAG: biopolymer transporter ExbD [Planctomycetaceae bacterium]|nr:MAG: biopolymer transporter ExbD [Planctomycetaceae bacterium]
MADSGSVDIDMTPMIDIVFQLITFFMVVINFDAADTDERVRMAVSELARPPKVKPAGELVLQMGFERGRAQGTAKEGPFLFYSGERIPVTSFETVFKPMLEREFQIEKIKGNLEADGKTKTPVVIRADAECPTGDVQKLIQICQQAGYEKFSLKAMQPEAK